VQATSREKGRQDTQQYAKSVQADLGLMPDCVLSPNHLLPSTFSPLKGEAIFSLFHLFTFKGRSHLFTFSLFHL